MAAHSVGPGTYSKTPKDFKQVFEFFDVVRHISQAAGLVVLARGRVVRARVPGVGARCGNGLFSTYKSPKILS